MQYRLYIDNVFVLEMIYHLTALSLINNCLRCTATHRRRVLASAIAALIQCVIIIVLPGKMIIRLFCANCFGCFVVLEIAYGISKKHIYSMLFPCMGIEFAFGSALIWCKRSSMLYGNSILWLAGYPVLFFVVYKLFVIVFNRMNSSDHLFYEVEIHIGSQQKAMITALVDTGNHLREPISGAPVALISTGAARQISVLFLKERYHVIPYQSVGKKGILEAYEISDVQIRNAYRQIRIERMMIAICENGIEESSPYQMILHPEFIV